MAHPVLLVTYIFLALPILYDLLWGKPDLTRFPGLEVAQVDPATNHMYLWYVSLLFPTFFFFARFRARETFPTQRGQVPLPEFVKLAAVVFLIAPPLIVLFAPQPELYLEYAVSQRPSFTREVASYHAFVAGACRLAVVAAVALILTAKRLSPGFIFTLLIFLGASAWLQGKRSAIALILACLLFAFWQRGVLRGRRLVAVGLAAMFGLGLFSVIYQDSLRQDLAIANSYEGFRLDYGRDASVQLAIYSVNNPEHVHVIEPGQTLPLYIGQLVPRVWWVDKPYPYAQYLTSAAFLQPSQLWGWGLTTSWFGEWVSNIGPPAFVVAPALLGFLCRLGDRIRSSLTRAVVTLILVLLVVQHVAAFSYLIPIAFLMLFWTTSGRLKKMSKGETARRLSHQYEDKLRT